MNLHAQVQRARPDDFHLRLSMVDDQAREMRIEIESASLDLRHRERRMRNIREARLEYGKFVTFDRVRAMRTTP